LLSVGNDELRSITREALEEHRQVKTLLEELEALTSDRPAFDAKLKVLVEDVEHHVEEEEGEMFPLVEDQLDDDTLLRLGTLMQAEKQRFAGTTARTATAR
jgi:hemerythrin-like domain-containing protein